MGKGSCPGYFDGHVATSSQSNYVIQIGKGFRVRRRKEWLSDSHVIDNYLSIRVP